MSPSQVEDLSADVPSPKEPLGNAPTEPATESTFRWPLKRQVTPQSVASSVDKEMSPTRPRSFSRGRPLFVEEVDKASVPGNLHLSGDAAVSRHLTKFGPVVVAKQLAADLAEREAQISLIRRQNEDRERELKRMLVSCGVSTAEIERRLINLDTVSIQNPDNVLDELMSEAINEPAPNTGVVSELTDTNSAHFSGSRLGLIGEELSDENQADHTEHTEASSDRGAPSLKTSSSSDSLGRFKRSPLRVNSANTGGYGLKRKLKSNTSLSDNTLTNWLQSLRLLNAEKKNPVELEAIVPQDDMPPTLLNSWRASYRTENDVVTDKYGFIYGKTARHDQIEDDTEDANVDNSKESEGTRRPKIDLRYGSVAIESVSEPIVAHSNANVLVMASDSAKNHLRETLSQLTEAHDDLQKKQTGKWHEFLRRLDSDYNPEQLELNDQILGVKGELLRSNTKRWREYRDLVKDGIPVTLRAKIWGECSGARVLKIPGRYDHLVHSEDTGDAVSQIDLDLCRTMPQNIFFAGVGPGVPKLRRVLVAFSHYNPEIGYCQGMNVIAGTLLLIFPSEEDAFWLLVSLVENILPSGYFSTALTTCRADQKVFVQYFVQDMPVLSSHLSDIGVLIEAITFDWFLSCFTDTLPPEALFRIWDVLLCTEGSVQLFCVALALFKIYEPHLMKLNTAAEVYSFMKNLHHQTFRLDQLISLSDKYRQFVTDEELERRRAAELAHLLG